MRQLMRERARRFANMLSRDSMINHPEVTKMENPEIVLRNAIIGQRDVEITQLTQYVTKLGEEFQKVKTSLDKAELLLQRYRSLVKEAQLVLDEEEVLNANGEPASPETAQGS